MNGSHELEHLMSGLLEASHQVTLEQLPAVVARFAPGAGMEEVVIYLTDLQQNTLRRLVAPGTPPRPGDPPDDATVLLFEWDGPRLRGKCPGS
ncbi:hypothetical protein [Nonomuraea sp. NPDC049709]|uniref:hypothetical protein n=1 Tax=Nonomuraea sp. NPDC049709 TaxID=3154736 RepID=UPI00344018AC